MNETGKKWIWMISLVFDAISLVATVLFFSGILENWVLYLYCGSFVAAFILLVVILILKLREKVKMLKSNKKRIVLFSVFAGLTLLSFTLAIIDIVSGTHLFPDFLDIDTSSFFYLLTLGCFFFPVMVSILAYCLYKPIE
jgi:hypothetical protein